MYLCDSHSTISFITSDGFCEDSICLSSIKPTGLHTAALYQHRVAVPVSILGFSDFHLIFCEGKTFLHLRLTSFSDCDPVERIKNISTAVHSTIY